MCFVDFTYVPQSRYLFQGADLEKCTAGDTLDSSSSSDNPSLNHNAECKVSSPCSKEDQQPDDKSCKSLAVELSSQKQCNDIKPPSSSQSSSTVETDKISYHNETTIHDTHEPCSKKPKLN